MIARGRGAVRFQRVPSNILNTLPFITTGGTLYVWVFYFILFFMFKNCYFKVTEITTIIKRHTNTL